MNPGFEDPDPRRKKLPDPYSCPKFYFRDMLIYICVLFINYSSLSKDFILSRDMVLTFVNSLVPTVRRALCDQTPEVRAAAAKTFDSLHNTVGSRYDFYLAVT